LISHKKALLHKARLLSLSILYISVNHVSATEISVKGVVDLRVSAVDSIKSYADGGHGKLGLNDGSQFSLSQLGADVIVAWNSGLSARFVANGYANEAYTKVGLTEGYINYRSLPSSGGYRWNNRSGAFYPKISLENNAIAWASKNTLNSSMINTWIGEEIRVLGSEFTVTRLGKFNDLLFDTSLSLTAFVNNDPAGSLLSWHGWTLGNQQTLWTESRKIAWFPAHRPGYDLEAQAPKSDPFLEVDNRVGYHAAIELKRHKRGHVGFGFYNNNGTPYIVKKGQYAWRTRFAHAQALWIIDKSTQFSAQYLQGDTLMQHPHRADAVNNDYQSGYVALSKRWKKHRFTGRLEGFSVEDNDTTVGDNNNEHGTALILSYQYRLSRGWFVSGEYNVIDSHRPARQYVRQPINLTEQQLQLSARYFFSSRI
jgi:hypothetical protein